MKKIIVVFGKPGAGKDFVTNILYKQYGYFPYLADDDMNEEYLTILSNKKVPTARVRQEHLDHMIRKIKRLIKLHDRLVVNWVFVTEVLRETFAKAFPKAEFLLVNTPRTVIEKRLSLPRKNHPIVDLEYALFLGDLFEPIKISHKIFHNRERIHLKQITMLEELALS